jgi:hypothetical protein
MYSKINPQKTDEQYNHIMVYMCGLFCLFIVPIQGMMVRPSWVYLT